MEDIQILHFLIASVLAFEQSVHFHDQGKKLRFLGWCRNCWKYLQESHAVSFLRSKLYLRFANDPKGSKKSFCHNSEIKRHKTGNVALFLNGANYPAMETDEVVAPRVAIASGISSRSPRSLCLEFMEENCQQRVRIKAGIAWENSPHKHSGDEQSCIQAVEGAVWCHCKTVLLSLKGSEDWSLHNHWSVPQWLLKKSPKGNCLLISLTAVRLEIHVLLEHFSGHRKEEVMGNSQRASPNNLIAFYSKTTGFADEEEQRILFTLTFAMLLTLSTVLYPN